MIETALTVDPTSLIYLPYLSGERSPFSDPFARGAFIGLNQGHTPDDLARAVLEGVIYAYRHALDALIDSPMESLTLTGGGTRSRRWAQAFADANKLHVQLTADASNVGVRGAVIAALVASGQLSRCAPPGFFQTADTFEPRESESARHDRLYALFREAYPALRSIFGRLH
jgi:xylulokinase